MTRQSFYHIRVHTTLSIWSWHIASKINKGRFVKGITDNYSIDSKSRCKSSNISLKTHAGSSDRSASGGFVVDVVVR